LALQMEKNTAQPQCCRKSSRVWQLIYGNARQVVEQHQYLFETLWKSGMDASERIRQLEHGVALAKTETLNFEQSVCKGGELVKSGRSIDILIS
jgi:hypothetical protein